MSTAFEYPRRHAITVKEFLRMGSAGVFAPDARLELIEGEILEMAPIHPPHAGAVNALTQLMVQLAGGTAVVTVQNPVIVDRFSMPQPDLLLLKPRADFYSKSHPTPADVLLAIEVSDSTLRFDLTRKAPLYARRGIREFWVMDVNARSVHVFRCPTETGYSTHDTIGLGEEVAAEALPSVRLAVAHIFLAD